MKDRYCIPGPVFWATLLSLATFFYLAHCFRETESVPPTAGHGSSTVKQSSHGYTVALPILLILATVATAAKMLYEHYRSQLVRWTVVVKLATRLPTVIWKNRAQTLLHLPAFFATLCATVAFIDLLGANNSDVAECCPLRLNPDIGGKGVRVSLYLPIFATMMCLLLGHFHGLHSGANELAMGLLTNLTYLTVNLISRRHTLTSAELMVVCISIDITGSSISMVMLNKEVMANKLYIGIGLLMQSASMVAVSYSLTKQLTEADAAGCCGQFRWWSVTLCDTRSLWSLLPSLLYRTALWMQALLLCYKMTPNVDRAEKSTRQKQTGSVWEQVPATATADYLQWAPLIVHGIASMEHLVSQRSICMPGGWLDWGQSAPLVVAIVAVIHWLYTTIWSHIQLAQRECTGPMVTMRISVPLEQTRGWWHSMKSRYLELLSVNSIRTEFDLPFDLDGPSRPKLERPIRSLQPRVLHNDGQGKELRDWSKRGDVRAVTELLVAGVVADAMDENGTTPLMLATEFGHKAVCELLLDFGADTTIHSFYRSKANSPMCSPLHLAAQTGQSEILTLLSSHVGRRETSSWSSAPGVPGLQDALRNIALSPLQLAVARGNSECVRILMKDNFTTLPQAKEELLELAVGSRDLATIQVILFELHSASERAALARNSEWLHSVVLHAPCKFCIDLLEALKLRNWSIATRDRRGRTLLHVVAQRLSIDWSQPGHLREDLEDDLVQTLVQSIDIQARDPGGCTALHYAAQYQKPYLIQILIQLGSHVNALDRNNRTPLSCAFESDLIGRCAEAPTSLLNTVRALLNNGADSEGAGSEIKPMQYLDHYRDWWLQAQSAIYGDVYNSTDDHIYGVSSDTLVFAELRELLSARRSSTEPGSVEDGIHHP